MKYNLKISDRSFEVEIEDINKRPIVVSVNGREFLVTPETKALETPPATLPVAIPLHPGDTSLHEDSLLAPLPGTVIEVFVRPGDEVESGQVVLIIEAMKMKNSIRSTVDGIVSQVLVSAGQTVNHKQILLEFKK